MLPEIVSLDRDGIPFDKASTPERDPETQSEGTER
jgi:hypothetical protein